MMLSGIIRVPARSAAEDPPAGGNRSVGCVVVAGNVDRERSAVAPVTVSSATGQRTVYVRHPGDVVRVALGAVVVIGCSLVASAESVSGVETGLLHAINPLPCLMTSSSAALRRTGWGSPRVTRRSRSRSPLLRCRSWPAGGAG